MDETIAQLISLTGCSDVEARSLLEACGGDVNAAAGLYMDTMGARAEPQTVRAPIPQMHGMLMDGIEGASSVAPARGPHFIGLSHLVPNGALPDLLSHIPSPSTERIPTLYGIGEGGSLPLAEVFRPPVDLIHPGSFEAAKQVAKTKNQWLLVNLQDSKSFASQELNRDVWSDVRVRRNLKGFLFWQRDIGSADGSRFAQLYPTVAMPDVCVIDPRTGERVQDWPWGVVKNDANSWADALHGWLSVHLLGEDQRELDVSVLFDEHV